MVYTLFNHKDGCISQTESLGVILGCAAIDIKYGCKISDMTLYESNEGEELLDIVVSRGTIIDLSCQLSLHIFFVSLIRHMAKHGCNRKTVKQNLILLRKQYQTLYK